MIDSQVSKVLTNLKIGQNEIVEGINVQKIDDAYFLIKGNIFTIEDSIKIIKIINNSKKTLPFKKMLFSLVRPPSYIISQFKVENKEEYDNIVKKAKSDNMLLYYSYAEKSHKIHTWFLSDESTLNINKGTFTLTQDPIEVKKDNIESVTEMESNLENNKEMPRKLAEQRLSYELKCPFCGKKASSTPGRTLHVKTKHPDKYEEYRRMM